MITQINKKTVRSKELWCVIFGHKWDKYGAEKNHEGAIINEWNKCSRCSLEIHDKSGLVNELKKKYPNL